MADQRVVVVGGSLGGLRAAEQLRACGFTGALTVAGAEPHLPYNRPPLSKEALAEAGGGDVTAAATAERLAFRRRASTADVEFRLGDPAVASDLTHRSVRTAAGVVLDYDGLVVASGLRPRALDVPGPRHGALALRTVEDCHALRAALARREGQRVVVVGAGFIGCEVASTLRALGHHPTVVEPAGPPMERVLGSVLAAAVQRHHEERGIDFVIGAGVSRYLGDGHVSAVELSTGQVLPATVVVEAVGSVCNTEWLEGNGLDLRDGVLTDNALRVAGATGAVAVGDLARFPNPRFDGVPRRVEHWSMPTDTARRAAATLAAELRGEQPDPTPFAPVPSFWSDQLGLRFQSYGAPGLADEVRIDEGDPVDLAAGLLATYLSDGRHVGTVAVNLSPARLQGLRAELGALATVS